MKVGQLTEEQKISLEGQLVQLDWGFNPFESYGVVPFEWVISTEEIDNSTFPENEWVKTLPLIDYVFPISGDTQNYFTQFFSGNSQN
jgi:hypothetical protein